MDEFSSEDPRPAETAAERDSQPARHDRARDEWPFRIVTTIAIVEAAILIVAGIWLSRVFSVPTGTIIVDSVPPAAEVRIDGALAGVTPLSLTAEVRITSEPAAAQVSIDGVERGQTPLVVPDLTPGSHAISLRSDGGQVNRSIQLSAGQPQSLHVLLPANPADPGWVAVGGATALRVFDGGRLVGATGTGRIPLSPGPHELEFVNEELALHLRQRVVVRSGRITTVTPVLPQGSLAITAQPSAEVWVNDELAGETPLGDIALPVGHYDVLLRHPEFGERKTRVRVTADAPARVHVDMGQRPEGE